MIFGFGNKKRKGFKNLVLSSVLVAVLVSQLPLLPAKKARAADDDMSKAFPPSSSPTEVGTGLPANIPITGNAYTGYDKETEYIVSNNNLKISVNPAHQATANNAFFNIEIHLGGEHQAAVNKDGSKDQATGKDTYTSDDEIGSWQSLFDTNSDGSLPLKSNWPSQGIFLEIGRGVSPAELNLGSAGTLYSPPISPILTQNASSTDTTSPLLKQIALDSVIDFTATDMTLPITVGASAGLVANTSYYARIRLEEDFSTSVSYSNIIPFTTGTATTSEGGGGQNVIEVAITSGESVATETNNAGLVLDLIACEWTSPTTWVTGCIVYLFYYILYIPSTWILMAAGWLLDVSTVFSLSNHIYQDPSFIASGWKIVRDISNIFFILILIYLAFKMILNLGGSDTKKTIASIVLVAVLLNFSLFFTKVVIDASNILGRIFYSQITITGSQRNPVSNSSVTGIEEKSLSQALADGFNVNKMMSAETIQKMNQEYSDTSDKFARAGYGFLIILMALIVNLIAAWSFFIVALLFIGRVVALWVAMIFSAFAFTSSAVPWLSKIDEISFGSWLPNLFKVSFLAPIFLFFVYIILAFVNSNFLDGLFNHVENFSFTSMMVSIIMQFAILITLVKKSQSMAQEMAGKTGGALASGLQKGISTVGSFVAGAAVAVATGGAAAVGRGLIGRQMAGVANSKALQDRAAGVTKGRLSKLGLSGIDRWQAEQRLKAAQGLSKASFDARGSDKFQSAMGMINKKTGFNLTRGKAQVGGWVADVETKKKAELEAFERMKTKKTDAELINELPENKAKKEAYDAQMKTYDEGTEKLAEYMKTLEEKRKEASQNNPNFDNDKFTADYMAKNPKPEAPEKPQAPTYITAADVNKQRQDAYAEYLRSGTTRAKLEDVFGAGEIIGAGRTAQLAAAKKLTGETKDQDKVKGTIKKLRDAEKETTKALDDLKNNLNKFNETYGGMSNDAINKEVDRKVARYELDANDIQAKIDKFQQEYDNNPSDLLKQNLANEKANLTQKQREIEALKNTVANKEKWEKEKENKEDRLEKIQKKISDESKNLAPGEKPKEEPKK